MVEFLELDTNAEKMHFLSHLLCSLGHHGLSFLSLRGSAGTPKEITERWFAL